MVAVAVDEVVLLLVRVALVVELLHSRAGDLLHHGGHAALRQGGVQMRGGRGACESFATVLSVSCSAPLPAPTGR